MQGEQATWVARYRKRFGRLEHPTDICWRRKIHTRRGRAKHTCIVNPERERARLARARAGLPKNTVDIGVVSHATYRSIRLVSIHELVPSPYLPAYFTRSGVPALEAPHPMGSRDERKACPLGGPPGGCGKQKKEKTRETKTDGNADTVPTRTG